MINWESGQVVEGQYINSGMFVEIENTKYPIMMPKIEGNTPLTPENLNENQNEFLELLDKTLKYNGEVPTDWNDARTFGVYHVSGSGYSNAIHGGGLYGILIVYESTGGTWAPTPNGNSWIWQEFRDTAGGIYKRYAVNDANGWSAWDDTGWVNANVNSPASPISWSPLQYRRKGDTVFIHGGVTYGQTPAWETQLASIPAEFAPQTEADFACRATGSEGTTIIAITANGEINYLINSANSPGDGLLISASYLIG